MPVNDPGSQNGPATSGSSSSSADSTHRFRVWIWLASLAIVLFSFFKVGERAEEAAYPSRPIELIVPFGAGGGTDAFARMMKKAIDDENLLPVPLVIRNVGGAGATIGSRQAKDAAPDGYTVLLLHNALLTAKFAGMVDYGPEAFEPIAATGEVGMVIAVASASDYTSLRKLMDATKNKPNTVSFGANLGALTHFAGLQLEQTTKGSVFRYVASGGGAERLEDLLGGHVDVSGFSIEEFIRYRAAGLRGLAYLGVERHAGAPHILTAQEQGYDAVRDNVFMWWFPKGTDPKKVDLFAGVLKKTMQTKFVQRKMAQIECDPIFLRDAALQQRIDATMKQMAAVKPPPETKLPNFPAIMFGAVLCMVPVVVVVSIRERRMQAALPPKTEVAANITQQYGLAAAASGLTMAYAAALSFGWIGFTAATLVYVLLIGDLLTRSRARLLRLVLVTSCALSFGVHAVFTHVFEVILP